MGASLSGSGDFGQTGAEWCSG